MPKKSELTRAAIRRAAFKLFLKHGLEGTTMRAIASEANVATGLLYRYFPSKDAIVLEFYAEHTSRVELRLKKEAEREVPRNPADRFRMALTVELDSLSKSQSRLLLALIQLALTPSSPAWLFSKETEAFRAHARGSMRWVLEHAHVSGDALETLVYALWALRMALLYFALNDVSPQQKRSHTLIEEVSHLLVGLPLLAPLASPLFARIGRMLRDAGIPLAQTE